MSIDVYAAKKTDTAIEPVMDLRLSDYTRFDPNQDDFVLNADYHPGVSFNLCESNWVQLCREYLHIDPKDMSEHAPSVVKERCLNALIRGNADEYMAYKLASLIAICEAGITRGAEFIWAG